MANKLIIVPAIVLTLAVLTSCDNTDKATDKKSLTTMEKEKSSGCTDECMAKSKSSDLACKLSTPELQKRKATVIASLKQQVIERKELKDGYAFKFSGTDKILDELTEFIKTERECCDFFTFGLSISGDKSEAWLELTGADGAKDFISSELGLTE